MNDKVAQFPYPQELTTVEAALREASESDLTDVLVLGFFSGDNTKIYIRSSGGLTNGETLFLHEHARMGALKLGPYSESDTK